MACVFDPSAPSTAATTGGKNNKNSNNSETRPVCPYIYSACVWPGGATAEVGNAYNTCVTHARYKLLLFFDSSDMRLKWKHMGQGLKGNDVEGGEDGSNEEQAGD